MAQNKQNNVLIVGGSSGVGLATAKLALTHLPGANVIISSSNKDKCAKAVEEIKSEVSTGNHIVDYIVGDISRFDSQFDDVEAILKAATEKFNGQIDHIVWTAGSLPTPPPPDQKPSHSVALGAATTRSWGPATLMRLAKKYMNDTRRSSITITSGVLAYRPMPGLGSIIGASSMEGLARGLAVDLAPIRSNFIVLGAIQTPLLDRLTQDPERAKQLAERTLAKSIGGAEEAAEAYLFSMRCGYVTGSRIDCDGGSLLV